MSFGRHNSKDFWKGISQLRQQPLPRSQIIDGANGISEIVKLCNEHYRCLLNSVSAVMLSKIVYWIDCVILINTKMK